MTEKAVPSRWFTVTNGADRVTAAAIYRAALAAQRSRIEGFSVDVVSDAPWPAEISWAVVELEARRGRVRPWFLRWLPRDQGPTVNLTIADDHDFDLAMAIAPFSIGGIGITDAGTIIWDGNDTGTSGAFQLTDDEVEEVRRFVVEVDADPTALVPLVGRGCHSS